MSRYHSYIQNATTILTTFKGEQPFNLFLKNYFSLSKKFGSTDRKTIRNLCYSYFRLGKSLQSLPIDEKILVGIFLCSTEHDPVLEFFKPEWNQNISKSVSDKISIAKVAINAKDVFPWTNELSQSINHEDFTWAHLVQPDLFIRIRPGKEQKILSQLKQLGLSFIQHSPNCIALPNITTLNMAIDIDKDVVIQDYNSQQVSKFLQLIENESTDKVQTLWDCCAASGGKSIMAFDMLTNLKLTVTDVRVNILANLKQRFADAGIKKYSSFITDSSLPVAQFANKKFDIIIADVPCSGSGTWRRTPEQLNYFEENKIDHYSNLQKKIVANISNYLNENGHLLYVTCSVFAKENEEMVQYIQEHCGLKLISMELLNGTTVNADNMFAALLKKSD